MKHENIYKFLIIAIFSSIGVISCGGEEDITTNNSAPVEVAINDFDGAGQYYCSLYYSVGGQQYCNYPTLTAPDYADADGDSYSKNFYLNGQLVHTGDTYTPSNLPASGGFSFTNGAHEITVTAIDGHGAASIESLTFKILVCSTLMAFDGISCQYI